MEVTFLAMPRILLRGVIQLLFHLLILTGLLRYNLTVEMFAFLPYQLTEKTFIQVKVQQTKIVLERQIYLVMDLMQLGFA